jgi:Zn-dependent protease
MKRSNRKGVLGGQSWSVGRVAGIEIAIDRSWLLIFGLITFSLARRFAGDQAEWGVFERWGTALVTSLLFFTSIVLHELGHSLVALRCGVDVKRITLFLFGGMAELDSEPRRPRDEIAIAVAGPLTSVAIGLCFGALAGVLHNLSLGLGPLVAEACSWLSTINVVLAVFNCLPGFPLDGGRVLRGIVWWATGDFQRATALATRAGSAVAYGLMGLGLFSAMMTGSWLGGLWLVFIGWFLLSAGRATLVQSTFESVLSQLTVGRICEPVVPGQISGMESVDKLAREGVLGLGLRHFYVVDSAGALRGLVALAELAAVPEAERISTRADEIMRPIVDLATVAPDDSAWTALRRMAETGVGQLPVIERGRLRGTIRREHLLDLVRGALALQSP